MQRQIDILLCTIMYENCYDKNMGMKSNIYTILVIKSSKKLFHSIKYINIKYEVNDKENTMYDAK